MTIAQKVRKSLNIKNRSLCGGENLKIISGGYEVENFKIGSKNKLVASGKYNEYLHGGVQEKKVLSYVCKFCGTEYP